MLDPIQAAKDWVTAHGAIETELWEPVPDKPGYVRIVRTRTFDEILLDLAPAIRRDQEYEPGEGMTYWPRLLKGRPTEWHSKGRWMVSAAPGSNEGYYVCVDMCAPSDDPRGLSTIVPFLTIKFLGNYAEALWWANYLTVLLHHW